MSFFIFPKGYLKIVSMSFINILRLPMGKSFFFICCMIFIFLNESVFSSKNIEQGSGSVNVQENSEPTLLEADEITFDETISTTTARGNVQITCPRQNGTTILQADTVTFNEKTHIAIAVGHVILFDPSGDVYKSDYAELDEDLKNGFIEGVRLLTHDNRRLVAISGIRKEGPITTLKQAVYSPCNLCKDDPSKAPLWQIKADKVIRDEPKGDVDYKNAWMEFSGVPVFYTPYLSHPDPSVKRRSGFLTPFFGTSTDMGLIAGSPYYYVINDSQDLTITPLLTTKETPVLISEYRQRFAKGAWEIQGSVTKSKRIAGSAQNPIMKPEQIRGHVQSKALFNLNDSWRTGFDINRASDPTYIRRYAFTDIASKQTGSLDSTVFAEGFYNKSYAKIQGYAFQPTRINQPQSQSPLIAPFANYAYVGPQRTAGDHFFANSSLVSLTRKVGTDMRRVSVEGGWQLPFFGGIGDLYTLTTSVRGDGYSISHFQQANQMYKGTQGRLFPQASLDWRYPLFSPRSFIPFLIEPTLGVVASPRGMNNADIPNEDSLDFELDETSIFRRDRFPGLDRVDSGQRFNYGTTFEFYPKHLKSASIFLGQSYQFTKNNAIPTGVGIMQGFSDIVGNFVVNPTQTTKLRYRALWDKETLKARRTQVGFEAGPPIFRVATDYLYVARNALDTSFNGKEQIIGTINSQFTNFWSAYFSASRDLRGSIGNLAQSYGLIYNDECFTFNTNLTRTFYQDRDIKPDNIIMFTLTFKTLGEVTTRGLNLAQQDRQNKAQNLLAK